MGVLRTALITAVIPAAVLLAAQLKPAPSLLIVNARIFTGVPATPWAEAVAITGERISAVGMNTDVRGLATSQTRVLDAAGRLVIPGINDAHVHIGVRPTGTKLEGPPAVERDPGLDEVLVRLKAATETAPKDSWIFGEIGASVLDDPKATRFTLDAIAAQHLVVLTAWTGHGALLNTAALRRLGFRDDEPDPPGGFFARVPGQNTITGVAHEYATDVVRRRIGALAGEEAHVAAIRSFALQAASFGITSIQWMLTSSSVDDAARRAGAASVPLRMRLIDFPVTDISAWREPGSRVAKGPPYVTVSGTKWILDGTPLERLAFLREPYADRQNVRGQLNFPAERLTGYLRRAFAARDQPMFHAVGDAAIDGVLDGLERSGGDKWEPLRPRIEHGDMLEPAHFERTRRLGVIIVQNPSHFMLAPLMNARLGDRARRASMMKSMIAANVPVALGSDGPLNPYLNLMFATILANNPSEAMTREQAIRAYTLGSARAEFAEAQKGTIAPGMLADLAMLSQDIFTVPTDALPATTSVFTLVGGRVAFEKN